MAVRIRLALGHGCLLAGAAVAPRAPDGVFLLRLAAFSPAASVDSPVAHDIAA